MTKLFCATLVALAVMLVASPANADEAAQPTDEQAQAGEEGAGGQETNAGLSLASLAAIGAGLVILGAGFGIGRIGGQAVEGMSRQPEAANSIQTAMIISAALIEGATFFALIVCIMARG